LNPEDRPLADERTPPKLVEHFFRHEYGRLVALLTKQFGLRHLDLVEDMVQSALAQALQTWRTRGVPDEPTAWIYRVARNRAIDRLRRDATAEREAHSLAAAIHRHAHAGDSVQLDQTLDSDIEDGLLRLIFACSHPSLAPEARVALTLKTLCGFSVAEIARGLLIGEENAKKRITRAKQQLAEEHIALEVPAGAALVERLESVHTVLYLMFNEGYSTTDSDQAIRRDVCAEAARLCHLLTLHPRCSTPATSALLALMLFHAARFDARQDQDGCLVLLEDQDRSRWDQALIRQAIDCLRRSAQGDAVSLYHLEAGIAMYHCKAQSFAATDWNAILRHYDLLLRLQRSPIYELNRAIALAHVDGPQAGIAAIQALQDQPQLRQYPLFDATLGELHRRAGNLTLAADHLRAALRKTRSAHDRQLLERRLAQCGL
jgi:RNA polymerase sigma-70 factor (ECF subfamily)